MNHACRYLQELCELNFGSYPDIQVDGQLDTMFPYIDVHLEYIMTELLKNSLRAVVEYGEKIRRVENPPILVTIGCGPGMCTTAQPCFNSILSSIT